MYQADSWYMVLFELLLVGTAFYNSLRMTRWWNVVGAGAAVSVSRSRHVPSVADYYKMNSSAKRSLSSRKSSKYSESHFAGMGDTQETNLVEVN